MKKQIDKMNDDSGWTISSGSITEIDVEELRASHILGQLSIAMDKDAILSKSFVGLTVAGLDMIGFTISEALATFDDSLRIKIYSDVLSIEYLVPLEKRYRQYRFHNPFTTITKIELIAKEDLSIIVTDLLAFRDEYPTDINTAIAEMVRDYDPERPIVGSCPSATAGKKELRMNTLRYVEKFSVIQVGAEIHHVESVSTKDDYFLLAFTDLFDGKSILNTAVLPVVKLYIPVLVNPKNVEASAPSISIEGGFDPEKVPGKTFNAEETVCTDKDGNLFIKRLRGMYKYKPAVHALFRSQETESIVKSILTQIAGNSQSVWINGRRHLATFQNIADIKFEDATGELQLPCEIEAGVYEWQTKTVLKNQTTTISQSPIPA